METVSVFAPMVLERWRRREHLFPGLVLVTLATVAWAVSILKHIIDRDRSIHLGFITACFHGVVSCVGGRRKTCC
jgi:hypothetical protein